MRGIDSAWPVFAVMVLFGAARAFAMPTGQAMLPNLVPREQFGKAVALNSSTWQVATIVGPALGGLLYVAGPATVYATVAVLLAAASAMTFTLRGGRRLRSVTEPQPGHTASRAALRWRAPARARRDLARPVRRAVRRRHGAAAGLCGGRAARRARRARRAACRARRRRGAVRRGVGVVPITRHVGPLDVRRRVALFGVATIVFGLSRSFAVSLVALTLLGAGDMVSVYIRHLLVQLETPDEIRGRVSAVNAVFIGASNELGEFESGVTAAWWARCPRSSSVAAPRSCGAVWMRRFRSCRSSTGSCSRTGVRRACWSRRFPGRVVTTVHTYSNVRSMRRADRLQVEKGRGGCHAIPADASRATQLDDRWMMAGGRWKNHRGGPRRCCCRIIRKRAITHNDSPDVPFSSR